MARPKGMRGTAGASSTAATPLPYPSAMRLRDTGCRAASSGEAEMFRWYCRFGDPLWLTRRSELPPARGALPLATRDQVPPITVETSCDGKPASVGEATIRRYFPRHYVGHELRSVAIRGVGCLQTAKHDAIVCLQ